MRLYELAAGFEEVINGGMIFDESTGEILFDEENLDELGLAFDEKLINSALFIKNTEADIEALKKEEQALAYRRKVAENKAKRMKDYVLRCLDIAGKKSLEDARVSIRTRNNKAVIVDDGAFIPHEYCTEIHEWEPDKKLLKQAIESGQNIKGATIEERTSLVLK